MMKKITSYTSRVGLVLVVLVTLMGASAGGALVATAAPSAALLPAATGVYDLNTNTRTFELWATTGAATLTGAVSVPIWGYSDTAVGAAQLPGPALIANAGENIAVILHNDLAEATALNFLGQAMIPDLVGVAPGGMTTYSFLADSPGTYLYEAGLLPNAQHQVALGMYGALIVRPAGLAGQAYDAATTAFQYEALVVLSEVDLALNNAVDPAAFDMRNYKPVYGLINGKAYPDTDPIDVAAAGDVLLLRYINAGQYNYSMSLLGLRQQVVGNDGSGIAHPYKLVAETVLAGQTFDMLVAIPATLPAGTARYPLFNGNLQLLNAGGILQAGSALPFGGMLTFITVTSGAAPGVGPTTSAVALSPNPTNGLVDVTLTATVGGSPTGAEYFIDAVGAAGTGTPMTDGGGGAYSAIIPAATVAGLGSGSHTFYAHGQDATGWGAFNFAVLNVDLTGPMTSALVLMPNPTNGTVDVKLSGTADDTASGNVNIAAAEYFIDAVGADGTGALVDVNTPTAVAGLSATIPAASVLGLGEGIHVVYVHSQDALGNWGAPAMVNLNVDLTGPTVLGVFSIPSATNGTLGFNSNSPYVRVYASLSDASSNVAAAEGFIDLVGAVGTGFLFLPADGLFNSPSELAYSDIPLSTIQLLASGNHTIFVRGKDSAGNWGATNSMVLAVDRTPPVVSGVSATPNPTNGAPIVTLTATATDPAPATFIAAAEWFEGADPGIGNGSPMAASDGLFNSASEALTASIDVTMWPRGNHTLYVRAKDAAGNWGTAASYVLNVLPPDLIFQDGFESGDFTAWSSVTGANATVTAAAANTGTFGMQVAIAGATNAFVTDLSPLSEPQYFGSFDFDPNGTVTGQNNPHQIFLGFNSAGTAVVRVEYRRQSAGGGTYQIRAGALTPAGFANTAWFTITNAWHTIKFEWNSGPVAAFRLYIDSATPSQTLNGLNTAAYVVDYIQLGPTGLTAGVSGTEYFDNFASHRYTLP